MIIDLVKVFLPSTLSFLIGVGLTPIIAGWLYRYRMWKPKGGKVTLSGKEAQVFNKLHEIKEVGTPRMGGLVILAGVLGAVALLFGLDFFTEEGIFDKLNFLSRSQTWIPLAVFLFGGAVGFIDDYLEVRPLTGALGGLSLKKRLVLITLLAVSVGAWFYFKLDVDAVSWLGGRELYLGAFIIPFFVLVSLLIYSGGIIDGIDGLSGGVFAAIFGAYATVAFYQNQIDLASFCLTVLGGILAFLWFNIPPARFYLSETGSMALTLAISVVAFMTDTIANGRGVLVLPIIALPLLATTASVLLQLFWRSYFGRKLFLVAPLHHHFEALGWPSYKVAMRYWVISVIFAIIGIVVALLP